MDKWIVAVASGASHIAQHFTNLKKQEKIDDQLNNECFRCVSSAKEASSSNELDCENGFPLGDYEGSNVISSPSTFSYGLPTNRRSILRSRASNTQVIRPLSALESCLSAQLFNKHLEIEAIDNRTSDDHKKKLQVYLEENNVVSGVPQLPKLEFLKIRAKNEVEKRRNQGKRLCNSTTIGSSHETLLLLLGISFGIMASDKTNKREIEKLNGLLKHTENLVQDLHEELEMKTSLIVQEITLDDDDDDKLQPNSQIFEELVPCQKDAKCDSFSKIEAELEAELEILQLSITSSSIKEKNFKQIELEADIHGDRRSTPPYSANYIVSPRDLSLRLHDVLETQLKERIRELESEIEKKQTLNQKKWKCYYDNHVADDDDEPVILNLSGEVVGDYNEAYDEFSNEEEDEVTDFSDEDEMEKILIEQIVEKARKGSPVVLNAQRVLFSME